MELLTCLNILRRSWQLVALATALAALASLALALSQPPRYAATARMLVTLGNAPRFDIEDPLAYDVPAIVNGRPFATDVAARLAASGQPLTPDEVIRALSATNQKRTVYLTATGSDPEGPALLLRAAADQLREGGLRYWGAAALIPDRPGLLVEVLDLPERAERTNGAPAIAREVALRALAGLAVGAALACIRSGLGRRLPTNEGQQAA